MKKRIKIIYEDEHFVIVDKPAQMLSVPDRYNNDMSVFSYLRLKYETIFPVHRLDKDTSGLLCMAKTQEAFKDISLQFEKRKIYKEYLAIVSGKLFPEKGIINHALVESQSKKGKMEIAKKGKDAVSEYELVEYLGTYSLVRIVIKTGRMHQIRVHMQSIGHPLAVDRLYSGKQAFYLSEIKKRKYRKNKDEEEKPLISRHTLHAHKLGFIHPHTNKAVSFISELPKDMNAMIKQLKKWTK